MSLNVPWRGVALFLSLAWLAGCGAAAPALSEYREVGDFPQSQALVYAGVREVLTTDPDLLYALGEENADRGLLETDWKDDTRDSRGALGFSVGLRTKIWARVEDMPDSRYVSLVVWRQVNNVRDDRDAPSWSDPEFDEGRFSLVALKLRQRFGKMAREIEMSDKGREYHLRTQAAGAAENPRLGRTVEELESPSPEPRRDAPVTEKR
ncbi:MAG: hypothetical protein HY719_12370 [Planctomycetes bacterium]|nr:hypothetical protein [Planctomycetota bacterium]